MSAAPSSADNTETMTRDIVHVRVPGKSATRESEVSNIQILSTAQLKVQTVQNLGFILNSKLNQTWRIFFLCDSGVRVPSLLRKCYYVIIFFYFDHGFMLRCAVDRCGHY